LGELKVAVKWMVELAAARDFAGKPAKQPTTSNKANPHRIHWPMMRLVGPAMREPLSIV
jgi:hypothetical protein